MREESDLGAVDTEAEAANRHRDHKISQKIYPKRLDWSGDQ